MFIEVFDIKQIVSKKMSCRVIYGVQSIISTHVLCLTIEYLFTGISNEIE